MSNRYLRIGLLGGVMLLVLVVLAVALTVGNQPASPSAPPTPTPLAFVSINCIIGSEKKPLLDDPDVQQILRDRYSLQVNATPKGSIDQVLMDNTALKGIDCLWPSNFSAVSIFESQHDKSAFPGYQATQVMYSPLVVYAANEARDAEIKAGLVEKRGDNYYLTKMADLVNGQMLKGMTWESLNADKLKGPVKVQSTNPVNSNSGNLLYMLILNTLAKDPYTPATLETARPVLPILLKFKQLQGLQFTGSEDVFESWMATGRFSAPLLAGYESQILEWSILHPDLIDAKVKTITVLYPEPTVQSIHVIIALTLNGQRLTTAMQDPEIQQIAWKKHGFRSIQGITNAPANFPAVTVPADITSITSLPDSDVILAARDCLKTGQCQ